VVFQSEVLVPLQTLRKRRRKKRMTMKTRPMASTLPR